MGLKEKLESLNYGQIHRLWAHWIIPESPTIEDMIEELLDLACSDSTSENEIFGMLSDVESICKLKPQQDHCPKCDSTDLFLGFKDWHGDQFSQDTVCSSCDFEFRQWYSTAFTGMTTVGEDSENIDIKLVADVANPKEMELKDENNCPACDADCKNIDWQGPDIQDKSAVYSGVCGVCGCEFLQECEMVYVKTVVK